MSPISRILHRGTPAGLGALAAAASLAVLVALPGASGADPSLGTLQGQLGSEQAHQGHLEASLAGLSQLISSLGRQIALVQSRESQVRADLAQDQRTLALTTRALDREQAELAELRARLARARLALARQLVSHYESDNPDLVDVVLESHGFTDMLDRLTYLSDAEHQQQHVIDVTRIAKAQATAAAARLARLYAAQTRLTAATALRARALAAMNQLLLAKQGALGHAQAVQRAALSASRARSGALRAQIAQIEAEQAAASAQSYASGSALGASAGWAIPYQIVLCESGGQNLPPNSAGASGYYQILPGTWRLFAGSGPAAYRASKAEQDAVAARIWNGGAGASNWVCAALVGIH